MAISLLFFFGGGGGGGHLQRQLLNVLKLIIG